VQAHPQFELSKNLGKILENLGKYGAQRCVTSKNDAQGFSEKQMKTLFLRGHTKKRSS